MYPPLYETAKSNAGVKSVLGNSPRVYPYGSAPDKASPLYAVPYVVHQIAYGSPENCFSGAPSIDGFGTQLDAYGATQASADSAASAMRDALQTVAYVVSYGPQGKEDLTGLYRYSFTVEWLTPR